jgi:hypothetical protein
MNMIVSTREARKQTDNVLYVYAIPVVILPAVAAARKQPHVTGRHIASRSGDRAAGRIAADIAARARYRHAGRCQPEW